MYQYCHDFVSWMFNGASTSVVDFFSCALTIGCMVLALLPVALIVKFIFKGR